MSAKAIIYFFVTPEKFCRYKVSHLRSLFATGHFTVNNLELMGAFTIVPDDPALIMLVNTVRNGISTMGPQSFSRQSKGLLKHSAAQHCSLSRSLFFRFSSSINLLFLTLFLFVTLIFSTFLSLSFSLFLPFSFPQLFLCKRERRAWIPHTDLESLAAQQHYCCQIFSISSESLYLFFSLYRKRW